MGKLPRMHWASGFLATHCGGNNMPIDKYKRKRHIRCEEAAGVDFKEVDIVDKNTPKPSGFFFLNC